MPNHWHALAAIWACQAGKDVYVEKPVSHNVSEGRRIVETARSTRGSSRPARSAAVTREFRTPSPSSALESSGRSTWPRGSVTSPEVRSDTSPTGQFPRASITISGLAPPRSCAFNPNRFHYNWHWFWDYGNGDLGNQGIHQMDLARWGLGKNELPRSVTASGGRFGYSDDGQTPNTLHVGFEFDDCELQFEVRGLVTNEESHVKIGDIFYGTEGILAITSYETWQSFFGPKLEKGPGSTGGRRPLRQLRQGGQGTRSQGSERRHRAGAPFKRLLPPGQYRVPAGPQAARQSLDRVVRR